jgi:hypothetical protein
MTAVALLLDRGFEEWSVNTNGAPQQSDPPIVANALAQNSLDAVRMECSLNRALRYGVKYD